MTKYKVVRSYGPNSVGRCKDLEKAFEDGYEFVRASEYIGGNYDKAGYIEYILKKEVEE
jgi:hypothetical protein